MKTILIVFILGIQSSYVQNVERPAAGSADTVQFVLVDGQAWRIKTYAIDHDVHVWGLGPVEAGKFEDIARANTQKHYGDVIAREFVVQSEGSLDSLPAQLKQSDIGGELEIPASPKFAFWVEQIGLYKTKSSPQQ
jgi:hypothetical protein